MADPKISTIRKRAAFVRTVKPMFAVVTYTDPATGEVIKLSKANLSIRVEKDMEKIVEIMEAGEGGTVVKLTLPAADKPVAPAVEAQAD